MNDLRGRGGIVVSSSGATSVRNETVGGMDDIDKVCRDRGP